MSVGGSIGFMVGISGGLLDGPFNIGALQRHLCDSHICLFQPLRSRVARIPPLRNLLGRTPLHRTYNRLRYDRRRKRRGQ
jgi:hypothetical protein